MPVPLSIAVPAAVAGLAYLNAKTSFSYDTLLLQSAGPAAISMFLRERRDRLNQFYVFEDHAKSKDSADRPFLLFEGKSYTYAQVYTISLQYGTWLRQKHGVKAKDIVAMDVQNSDVFIFCWLGLWSIGAKPAFINYNLTGQALAHCVRAATTKLMLVDPAVIGNVDNDIRKALPSVTFITLTPEVGAEIAAVEPVRSPDSDRSEDRAANMAILIYTSGTTGMPKAAIVSWAKCIVGSILTAKWLGRKPDSILYTSMPLYHSSAAVLALISTIECGATIAIGRKFSTEAFWRDVRETKATIIQYVGETCRYLLAAPPQIDPVTGENLDQKHNVKIAFGNGLRPDVWNKFKDRFGIETIGELYAATEGTIGTWNLSRNDFSKGAVGRFGLLYHLIMKISRSMDVRVVEVDFATDGPLRDPKTGFCIKVKSGEPGEMIVRLPEADITSRFQGYYANEKATNAKILRNVFRKGDAYFRTGDVVRWDSDGRIFFTDRIGDTFRWKSENVSTQEVSQAVGLHPAVREANVYGVQLPHHDGRAGCVAIVLDGQADRSLLRSLADHVKRTLPRYALPLFLRVMPRTGMQTTGTNKQQKHQLRMQGVRPDAMGGRDELYWLRDGTYVPFGKRDWNELNGGRVKL